MYSAFCADMKKSEKIIKALYPIRLWFSPAKKQRLPCHAHGAEAAQRIEHALQRAQACMIARFGATELAGMMCVRDVEAQLPSWLKCWKVFRGEMRSVHAINTRIRHHMADWSGFFPTTDDALIRFTRLMEHDAQELDVLGSWLAEEVRIQNLFPHACIIPIESILYPFLQERPWTCALEGKKVLVIHPFETSIRQQYEKRQVLYGGKPVFPTCELSTLPAVQSLRGEHAHFQNWFDALDWMKRACDQRDFDVALIGAGAYGFPLAAHIKRSGRKAVHVGGALQLFFGIMGNRWQEDPRVQPFVNEHWTRPLINETPRDLKTLESGGCYW